MEHQVRPDWTLGRSAALVHESIPDGFDLEERVLVYQVVEPVGVVL